MATLTGDGALARLVSQRRTAVWWLAVAAGAVAFASLVILAAQAGTLTRSLYRNADHAVSLVLPTLAGHAPAGAVVHLGNHAWYEPWWFMRLTAGLGDYRTLWQVAPFVFGLLGIGVVSVCAWRALGGTAGLVCAVALLAASDSLRSLLYVPESHGSAVIHLGILCAALLFASRSACSAQVKGRLLAAGVPLVAFTAAGFTDQLVLISGLGPFVLAPLICWLRSKSATWAAVSAFSVVSGLLALLFALLISHVMKQQHVILNHFPIFFVNQARIVDALQSLLTTIAALGGGAFFETSVKGANILTFAAGVLALLALAAILRQLWQRARWTPTGRVVAAEQSRELYVAYWGLVLIFVLGAFTLSSLSEAQQSPGGARYLIGAWVALAALLGILATTRAAQVALLTAVVLFGALNIRAELARGGNVASFGPSERIVAEIERFARAQGANIGYGGYWDAAPVTWETESRVEVFPITPCSGQTGVCESPSARISSWYVPRANVRSFLITDSRVGVPVSVGSAPPAFGAPLAETNLGEGFAVYVYDHDLASQLS